jgi:subtilase family serine protease
MRLSSSTGRRIVAGLGAGATVLAVVSVAQPASATATRRVVDGTAPKWLSHAKDQGDVSKSSRVNFGVLLKMRNQAQAVATLQKVSDPQSASYGKWLTNAQFNASYAPAASDVSAVRSWLGSQGFTVTTTFQSGMYVEASGTTSQVEKAFATKLHNYTYKGRTVHANTTALSLPSSAPASVSSVIQGVVGIDQGSAVKTPATASAVAAAAAAPATALPGPPPGSRYGVQPCSAYYGDKIATDKPKAYGKHQPYAVCGYYPDQYQSAYGETGLIKSGVDGSGVTVAITDAYASPTMLDDANHYSKLHGQPLFKAGQYREIRPSSYNVYDPADAQGWYGEETLDVEAVHGMAPGANVVFVSASDDLSGLDNAWAQTIDNHVADIVTNSWSDNTDTVATLGQSVINFYTQFSLEGALTGITDNFSTGDDGDLTAGGTDPSARTVGFPSDSPFVTGVGGTSVEVGSSGQWLGEYGWSNAYSTLTKGAWAPAPPGVYSSGGGGGTSQLYGQPFYQVGKVPAKLSKMNGKTPMRVIPDISMPGDPNTGMRVGETQQFFDGTYYAEYRIGGTSLSSPLLAGVIAVADQKAGHALGFVNPLYYSLIGTSAVHDLIAPKTPVAQVRTNYTNAVNPQAGFTFILQTVDGLSGSLHDTKGYDNETGVGSPNGPTFFSALAAAKG